MQEGAGSRSLGAAHPQHTSRPLNIHVCIAHTAVMESSKVVQLSSGQHLPTTSTCKWAFPMYYGQRAGNAATHRALQPQASWWRGLKRCRSSSCSMEKIKGDA